MKRNTIWTRIPCLLLVSILLPGAISHAQTRRAFLVGIDNYEPKAQVKNQCRKEWANLGGAVNDAEAVAALLRSSRFGFKPENVRLLTDKDAVRARILSGIKTYLIDNATPGDICVFYYAGHGSRVHNPASREPDRMDETLVPADWHRGNRDIRDKELKKLFNRVLDKGAHLTVIVDACHSGSISRGIPVKFPNRFMPPDPCATTVPHDNKKSPAQRGALILTAAQDFQAAREISYGQNKHRGLFTWALLKAMQDTGGAESVQNLISRVKAIMHSEGFLQEPNLEALPETAKKTILGLPARGVSGPLRVPVSRIAANRRLIELLGGVADGIRIDCQFKKVTEPNSMGNIRVQVTAMNGMSRCTARVIQGDIKELKSGDLFELDKWVAPREACMRIFLPLSGLPHKQLIRMAAKIAQIRESSRVQWIEDPTESSPSHIIAWNGDTWNLEFLNNGETLTLGKNPGRETILKKLFRARRGETTKPRVFLQLPLSVQVAGAVCSDLGDYSHSISVSSTRQDRQYLLVGRFTPGGVQYAWALPNMTQKEAKTLPMPARSAWIPAVTTETGFQRAAEKLSDKILRLARVRAWMQLSSPPGDKVFPYRLALRNAKTGKLTTTGTLLKGETYGLMLKMDKARLQSANPIQKRYVYVFTIDSFGKGTLLFPRQHSRNVGNYFPSSVREKGTDVQLGNEELFEIDEPYGIDTYFLLTTGDPLTNPLVLNFSGVRQRKPIGLTPLEELLFEVSAVSRKPGGRPVPTDWSLQRLLIQSKKK